jgi:hypothetical protein
MKVVRYSPVPEKSAITASVVKRPVTAPATASAEYQVRNKRSTKVCTVKDMWARISG